jgi:RNA polymerase sigma factor (sigma-70 family)
MTLTMTPTMADTFAPNATATATTELTSREEDQRLVDKARAGDPKAFDNLVVKYSPKLYGLIYHMTSNREDTNDLLQDVFSKAYRALDRFRGQSAFYTWLYSIATNMTLNHLKKRGRRQTLSLDDIDSGLERNEQFLAATSSGDPLRETNLKELQIRINEAMQKLSPDHRTVVTLYDIQGLAHAEIAVIMSVPEATVRSRLHYAHRHLQSLLADLLEA